MKSTNYRLFLCLRILLGCVFLLSSIAKLVDIDQFEIYVFSFGFVSLNTAFIFARLCIAGEMLLGVGLVSNLYGHFVNVVTQIVLMLFCIFLCYAALIGRDDNCQCFGTLLEFNPVQSIAKNAFLIVWSILASRAPSFHWRPSWYMWVLLIAVIVLVPFRVSTPDHWVYHDEKREIPYNQPLLEEHLISDTLFVNNSCNEGNKIIAFISPRCPWCKMCVEKIQTIQRRYDLPETSIIYVIPQQKESIKIEYHPIIISRELISRITYGQRPIIVFVQNGVPLYSRHYRSLDEAEILSFLGS